MTSPTVPPGRGRGDAAPAQDTAAPDAGLPDTAQPCPAPWYRDAPAQGSAGQVNTDAPADAEAPGEAPVEALRRGIVVLQQLNRQRVTTLKTLHDTTGLPKSTISRILKTLIALGFVTNDSRQGGYQITSLVESLSCGFVGDPLVVEASRPWLMDFTRTHGWPIAVAVPEGSSMSIRYTTSADTPRATMHGVINMRLSFRDHALGRAYLAYCDRDTQLRLLADQGLTGGEALEDQLRLFAQIRQQGYAERNPKIAPLNTNTLAVPVIYMDTPVAALSTSSFRVALKDRAVKTTIVEHLKRISTHVSNSMVTLRQNALSPSQTAGYWPSETGERHGEGRHGP